MTLKLRRDVLDQQGITGRLRQHLETVSRKAALSGHGGRQHNPAERAGLDDLGQLRCPAPTQQTVNLLERKIRARITTETVARAGDSSPLVTVAAGQVQGIRGFGRCGHPIEQNRQRTDAAGKLSSGVERSSKVVCDQA